jgi:tetratricopeptide (TPR) repeat protein
MQVSRCILLGVFLVAPVLSQRQITPEEAQNLGDYATAIVLFGRRADQTAGRVRVEASIGAVRSARFALAAGTLDEPTIQILSRCQAYLQQGGQEEAELYATDALAIAYLQTNRISDARRLYENTAETLKRLGKYRGLSFNYGRVLELIGDKASAHGAYLQAVREDPSSAVSVESLLRTIGDSRQLMSDVTQLYRAWSPDRIRPLLRSALLKFQDIPTLYISVQLYTFIGLSPARFANEEKPTLVLCRQTSQDPLVKGLINEVVEAFESPVTLDRSAEARFPTWSAYTDYRKVFSELLTEIGSQYNGDESDPGPAVLAWDRHVLAWQMDNENLHAVLRAVGMLSSDRRLDPRLETAEDILRTSVNNWVERVWAVEGTHANLEQLEHIYSISAEMAPQVPHPSEVPSRQKLLAAAVSVAAMVGSAAQAERLQAADLEQSGSRLLADKSYAKARDLFREAVTLYERGGDPPSVGRLRSLLQQAEQQAKLQAEQQARLQAEQLANQSSLPDSRHQEPQAMVSAPLPTSTQGVRETRVRSQLGEAAAALKMGGLVPSHEVFIGSLNNNTYKEIAYTLQAGGHYLLVGICDDDCSDLDLKLYDGNHKLIAEDTDSDDTPSIAVTAGSSGRFYLRVIMATCSLDPCRFGIQSFK